jgi:hypothetical protein
MMNFPNLAVGAIVYGAAGKSAKVVSIDGELLTIDTPAGIRTISVSKVAKVEPPEPEGIEIGDRLARSSLANKSYPKGWFPNGIDDRPPTIDAISATVTGFSADGYWAITDDGKQYHVSEYAIECGDWTKIRQNNLQN